MNSRNRIQLASVACFSMLLFAVSITTTERLIPNLENIFNILHAKAGIIISSNLLGFLIAMVIGGMLSDFLSKKILVVLGFVFMISGTFIFGFANKYSSLISGNLLIGLAGGLIEGIFSIVIMDLFKEKRGVALNFSQIFFGVGAGGAPFFATLFSSWRTPYFLIGCIAIVVAILTLIQDFSIEEEEKVVKDSPISMLFNLNFILIVFGMFFYSCTEMGIASWISALFIKGLKASEFWGTLALSSYWIGEFIGRLTIGLRVDRYDTEKLMSLLFFISSIFLLLALLLKNIVPSYIFFSMTGITMGPLWPTILSDARNKFTDYPGTAFGIIAGSGSFAGIIIPPIIGKIADIHSLFIGLYLTIITSFLSSLIYLYLSLKVSKIER